MVAEDESERVPDNTEVLLDSFLSNNEQTFDDFTNQFSFIDNEQPVRQSSVSTPTNDTSNLGSMLSYLNHRESQLVGGDSQESDLESDMRGLVSSLTLHNLPDLPQPVTNGGVTVNGGAAGCLDMMMNYLREREMTLETSEEYSIEVNTSTGPVIEELEEGITALTSTLDNRLHSDSSNCSNCSTSSSVPDNDRGARLQDLQMSREAQLTSLLPVLRDTVSTRDMPERIQQTIRLASEHFELRDNATRNDTRELSDRLQQTVSLASEHFELQDVINTDSEDTLETIELPSEETYSSRSEPKVPKVDNFISNNDYYDSDKDIDETEIISEDEGEVYIPSFFDDERSNTETFPEVPSTRDRTITTPKLLCAASALPTSHIARDLTVSLPTPPAALTSPLCEAQSPTSSESPSYHDCYTDFVTPLPGEFIENSVPEVVVHTRHIRQGSNNFLLEYTSEEYEDPVGTPNNDDVHPFQLDEGFDYDNVRCTPKPSPFR